MKQWILTNTGLKIVALTLAIFVWVLVKAMTSDSRTVEGIPLEIKTGPGLAATYVSARTVNVVVRGTTEDLRQASRYELFAVIDLQHDTHLGRHQIPVTPRDIRHPRRIQVISVEPAAITVRLEKAATD